MQVFKKRKRYSIPFSFFLLLAPLGFLPSQQTKTEDGVIQVVTVDGVIGPVSSEYILRAIDEAEEKSVKCLIVQLDTPGGLLESTRQITKKILSAEIPVILYVSPSGARAASAGVFICYAAHLVAMAPSTNIGAAHPVNLGGGADTSSVMEDKVTNDAVAQVKALAEKRGRNVEWAEKAVRESVSITETEALELNVINFISPSVDSLASQIHGMEVEVADGKMLLETRDAEIVYGEMNLRYRILEKISNPNVAYILMMLGIYGLFFELSNPGAIFPGVVGAIFLILAFYALQTLPVNYAGLLLILLAILLFILEVKIVSYGLLTIGGIISMLLGSLMLIDQPTEQFSPVISISLSLIIAVVILTAAFFLFAFGLAFKTHRQKVTTGNEGIIGEIGLTRSSLSPEGSVSVHGEIWKAISDEKIRKGQRVKVVSVNGLTLKVEKAES